MWFMQPVFRARRPPTATKAAQTKPSFGLDTDLGNDFGPLCLGRHHDPIRAG